MKPLTIHINEAAQQVPAGITVAAALALSGTAFTRRSVSGQLRAPLCGMGQCQECRVRIDGVDHQLACMRSVCEGMQIDTATP